QAEVARPGIVRMSYVLREISQQLERCFAAQQDLIRCMLLPMGRLALMAVLLLATSPAIQAQMRGGFRSGAGFGRPAPTVRFGGGFSSFHHSSSIFIGGRVGFGHNPRVHVFFGPSRRAFFHHRFITPYPVYYGYAPYY